MDYNKIIMGKKYKTPKSFEDSFASHPRSQFWNYEMNGDINPKNLKKSVNEKFWFKCDKCFHDFDTTLNNLTTHNRWCPYCCNPPQKLCEDDNCELCFGKSFASHSKSEYWSSTNELQPRQVLKSSGNQYWFKCGECHHDFTTTLNNISNRSSWCPYCSNSPRKLCGDNDCKLCFEKSFASHEKSKYWSSNNTVKPREVLKSSNKKYWFKCEECHHDFTATLNSINSHSSWCPYCCNPPQRLCQDNDCKLCLDKSFASHEKSKYWCYDKNKLTPRQVFKSSGIKYFFRCEQGHDFEIRTYHISYMNSWCPRCSINKAEEKLTQLCKNHNHIIRYEKTSIQCIDKNNNNILRNLTPDMIITLTNHQKIMVELDGGQHFRSVKFF